MSVIDEWIQKQRPNLPYTLLSFTLGTILGLSFVPDIRGGVWFLVLLGFHGFICYLLGRNFPQFSWRWGVCLVAPLPLVNLVRGNSIPITVILGYLIYVIVAMGTSYLGTRVAVRAAQRGADRNLSIYYVARLVSILGIILILATFAALLYFLNA